MKVGKATRASLVLGAIGVVFGDIGTSPLYVLPAAFGAGKLPLTHTTIYGVISLIVWALILVVSVKYLMGIMRIDNRGEGGIMALVALLQKAAIHPKNKWLLVVAGLAGMALFYGDSVITPAISVLSAVEGIQLVQPGLSAWVVPSTLAILAGLFILQSRGSGAIGRLFGPIMVLWLAIMGLGGVAHIVQHPGILEALLPHPAVIFIASYPFASFIVLGAVVLAVTGAEALYADMGHFGRPAIWRAWFLVVFPALLANYMGQGALLLSNPGAIYSTFYLLYPEAMQPFVVIIATLATVIASQAVIAGAFSLTHQAIQLGYAPRMLVRYTSTKTEGQVYIPALNWLLGGIVCMIVILFGSSAKLANAYGVAVSGALLVDTLLFVAVLARVKQASLLATSSLAVFFLAIDGLFVASTSTKLVSGGWLPLGIAAITGVLLITWVRGHQIVTRERHRKEQPLENFARSIKGKKLARLPGHAVYLGSHNGFAPLALEASVHQLHELHEKVVVVTVETLHQPHVPNTQRVKFDDLQNQSDGISHVTLQFGFKDQPNVPKALEQARMYSSEVDFNPYTATYFVSQQKPVIEANTVMPGLQKHLYLFMARNAMNASDYYRLPPNTTIQMSTYVEL